MTNVTLVQGEANPNDVRLTDPTRESVPLAAATTFAVLAVSATLTVTAAFAAQTGFAVAVDAPLQAVSTLEADASVQVGTQATLSQPSPLQASAGVQIGAAALLTKPAPLEATTGFSFASVAPLSVSAVPLAATTTVTIAVTRSTLSALPAALAATSGLQISTVATIGAGGPSVTSVIVTINGVDVTSRIRNGSIIIRDVLNEAPNTLNFAMDGGEPPTGAEIKVGLENLLATNLIFGGTIQRVEDSYEELEENQIWRVSCVDDTDTINRRKVFGVYTNVSGTAAAVDVLTRCAPGFVTSGIEAGLPPITMTFDGVDVMDALTQIATAVGGYAKVDYSRVPRLFITETGDTPDTIDGTDETTLNDPPLTAVSDVSQLRNRVIVIGKGVGVLAPTGFTIPAGAAVVPVDDATPFSVGQAIAPDRRVFAYTGKQAGGVASTVVGNVSPPSSGGSPALAAGVAGHVSGLYRYAVAFANGAGETPIGPPSPQIVAPDVASPASAPGLGVTGNVGPLVGAYSYKVAFLTTLGETLPGPAVSRTATAVAAGAMNTSSPPTGLSRLKVGSYTYRTTYLTALGETVGSGSMAVATSAPSTLPAPAVGNASAPGVLPIGSPFQYLVTLVTQDGEGGFVASSGASYTPSALSAPGLGSGSPGTFGGLYGGLYFYAVTIVTAVGESVILNTVNVGGGHFTGPGPGAVTWSGGQDTAGRIAPGTYFYAFSHYADAYGETPLGPSTTIPISGVQPIRLLMNLPNGGVLPAGADGIRIYRAVSGSAYALAADFRRGSVPVNFWDVLSQGELGAMHPVQTMRAGVNMTFFVSSSPEPGVVARRLYRTKAGGTDYFFVGELQHNSNAFFTDALLDTQLAQRNPAVNATGRQAALSGVATGPAGTIARRLYRTKAGGTQFFLIGELKDNVTTTWTDNAPDASLTVAMPGTNTAGSAAAVRLVVPTGPAGVVARRIYRSKVNDSALWLLAELANNTTTFYDDNTPDDALGSTTIPATTSAGGEEHQLTSVPIGPAGTLARMIYRTKAGGTEYFEVGRISDNTTTTFRDAVADSDLGSGVQLVNTAGSSSVLLSSIPIGPAGVTQRIIYRTEAGGSDFHYVGTIENNTATTFLDSDADSNLGRSPQATSTIGALSGDTSILLSSAVGFPAPGWVEADSQLIFYSSVIGNILIGIPSAGSGAIVGAIKGGLTVKTVPMLTGVSGLITPLQPSDRVSLWVVRNQLAAQAARAIAEGGGDGIHEGPVITDDTLASVSACAARADADLALFAWPQVTITYATRDRKTRTGLDVPVNLPAPRNIVASLKILDVTIDQVDITGQLSPRRMVKASNAKFSIEDFMRHAVLDR